MAIQLGGKPFDEIDLLPGETINHVFQGDGFFLGTNPMAKAIGKIMSFVTSLTGGHIRVFLVLTNMRVLLVQSQAVCCGWNRSRVVNAIASSSIKEAGIAKETQMCCFHTRVVHIQSLTERHTIVVKKFKDPDLKNFLTQLSTHIRDNTGSV